MIYDIYHIYIYMYIYVIIFLLCYEIDRLALYDITLSNGLVIGTYTVFFGPLLQSKTFGIRNLDTRWYVKATPAFNCIRRVAKITAIPTRSCRRTNLPKLFRLSAANVLSRFKIMGRIR